MPTSANFTGAGLALESLVKIGPATLRLKYTNDPLAASSSGVHDALNTANYAISGPAANAVSSISTVPDDPQSFNLALAAPLVLGSWTITASNIQTPMGALLGVPNSLSIAIATMEFQSPLGQGAVTDDHEKLLRKHISPALKGKSTNALIAALATGDKYNSDTAASAFDQLFKSTASGIYLDRRASDDGFSRPANIGIPDDIFRTLAIKTTARKQVIEVILETLEAFYGSEATRASSTSATAEPYALQDGDKLTVQVDGSAPLVITFNRADFSQLGAAKAVEVGAVITRMFRATGSAAYAVSFTDPSTSTNYVRIYSGALGLRGSVAVLGGRSQNVFKFPAPIYTDFTGPAIGTQWSVQTGTGVNGIPAGHVRFAWVGGSDPSLQEAWIGDIANIFGAPFNALNRGAFPVVDITPSYFEVENANGTSESVTQVAASDVSLYRPIRRTIQSTGRMATATQGDPSVLDVVLPASTQAVGRGVNSAAYLHAAPSISVASATRDAAGIVTITTSSAHGLSADSWVNVDGMTPDNTVAANLGFLNADPTHVVPAKFDRAAAKLQDGRVLVSGGDDGTTPTNSAFLYNSGWAAAAAMATARSGHTLTTLKNGKVLAIGGQTSTTTPTNATVDASTVALWRFDEAAGTTVADSGAGAYTLTAYGSPPIVVGQLGNARQSTSDAQFIQGDGNAALSSVFQGDYTIECWLKLAAPPAGQSKEIFWYGGLNFSATPGDIILAEMAVNPDLTFSARKYQAIGVRTEVVSSSSIALGQWTHIAATYKSQGGGLWTISVYINGTLSNSISNITGTPAVIGANDKIGVLCFEGFTGPGAGGSILHASIDDMRVSNVARTSAEVLHTYLTGTGSPYSTAELYDPATNTWSPTGPTAYSRTGHGAALLNDGRVMAAGGNSFSTVIELYDPVTGTWSLGPALANYHASGATATKLYDGRVAIIGGAEGRGHSVYWEIYNPVNGVVRSKTAPADISYHTATLAPIGPSGRVLVTGGIVSVSNVGTLYTFDPGTLDIASVGTFAARSHHSAVLLKDGNVLISGGADSSSFVFDTAAMQLHAGSAMRQIDARMAAVVLNNGDVLFTSSTGDSQLYHVSNTAVAAGGLNGLFKVASVPSATSLTFITPDFAASTTALPGGTITPIAGISNGIQGPFLFDPAIYVPENPEDVGAFYITAAAAGRVAASDTIDKLVAAGVRVNKTVVYPSDVGLGNEGAPESGSSKLSDKVAVWGGDSLDLELTAAREEA